MELEEKQLSSETLYTGQVFTVTKDEILLPDGTKCFCPMGTRAAGIWSTPTAAW